VSPILKAALSPFQKPIGKLDPSLQAVLCQGETVAPHKCAKIKHDGFAIIDNPFVSLSKFSATKAF